MGQSRETAISLAIGVQPRTAMDVFDFLRPHLLESLFWRQRLPVAGAAAASDDAALKGQLATLFQQLGQDVSKLLADARRVDAFQAQLRATRFDPRSASAAESVDTTKELR